MRDPDLILLDEPYAGLDMDARGIVADLLADAERRGRTVLLASHEPPTEGKRAPPSAARVRAPGVRGDDLSMTLQDVTCEPWRRAR